MKQDRLLAAAICTQESQQLTFSQRLVQANSVNDSLPGASDASASIERAVADIITDSVVA